MDRKMSMERDTWEEGGLWLACLLMDPSIKFLQKERVGVCSFPVMKFGVFSTPS